MAAVQNMADDLKTADVAETTVNEVSSLPNCVILYILSFLSTPDAVRVALTLQLRDFWTCLRDVTFNLCDWHECSDVTPRGSFWDIDKFMNFNNRVMAMHDGNSINRFLLKADVCAGGTCRDSKNRLVKGINEWINFALRKKAKAMDLNFAACSEDHHPRSGLIVTVSSRHLLELWLTSCEIRKFQFESLRKLSLTKVHNLGYETTAEIFAGCPKLEELCISGGTGLTQLRVPEKHPLENLRIKQDDLSTLDLGHSKVKTLILVTSTHFERLNCPNVTALDLSGHIQEACFQDMGSVFNAAIHLNDPFFCRHSSCHNHFRRGGCVYIFEEEFRWVSSLLEKLSNSSQFRLCTWIFMVFSIWETRKRCSPSLHWKSVTALLGLTKWIMPGLSHFLRHCKGLETLTVFFYPLVNDKLTFLEAELEVACNFKEGTYWSSTRGAFRCLQYHLKKVMVYGFVTDPHSVRFIEFMLRNSWVLEELEISTGDIPGESSDSYLFADQIQLQREHRMPDLSMRFHQHILEIPRASKSVVINFI